jgi:hypothetical protein
MRSWVRNWVRNFSIAAHAGSVALLLLTVDAVTGQALTSQIVGYARLDAAIAPTGCTPSLKAYDAAERYKPIATTAATVPASCKDGWCAFTVKRQQNAHVVLTRVKIDLSTIGRKAYAATFIDDQPTIEADQTLCSLRGNLIVSRYVGRPFAFLCVRITGDGEHDYGSRYRVGPTKTGMETHHCIPA